MVMLTQTAVFFWHLTSIGPGFRALYITIFKHLMFVGGRACCRTSLEFCKLLLSLDPDGDPLAVKLAIDFYALRAREYTWLIDFAEEWESAKNLSQLPNFAFSTAVAHFYTSNGDTAKADTVLQDALLMFPAVLLPLLEKCSVQVDARVTSHRFFCTEHDKKWEEKLGFCVVLWLLFCRQPTALTQLVQLYVNRSYHVWKDSDVLHWLEKNVHSVLDRVDKNEAIVKDYEAKRVKRYQGPLPRSIARHILLSDIKDLTPIIDVIISDVSIGRKWDDVVARQQVLSISVANTLTKNYIMSKFLLFIHFPIILGS